MSQEWRHCYYCNRRRPVKYLNKTYESGLTVWRCTARASCKVARRQEKRRLSEDLVFLWGGSRSFMITGDRGVTPIFDLLVGRLILRDAVAVSVKYGHDIPSEVWARLEEYERALAQTGVKQSAD